MDKPIPKKRGRKPKHIKELELQNQINNPPIVNVPKKRGRKPKGGRIIKESEITLKEIHTEPNIILHLKCNMRDLECADQGLSSNHFNQNENYVCASDPSDLNYKLLSKDKPLENNNNNSKIDKAENNSISSNDIITKLKNLSEQLHLNDLPDRRSDCFWCTCSFETPPIFIPKSFYRDSYSVYGSFCSPECACAFLFREKMDSSSRLERYHLLNYLYGDIYKYEKNITPAPDPYYTLSKYYGNLSITEYRKLLRNEQVIIVLNKPITKSCPSLFIDNNEFSIKNLENQDIKNKHHYKLCRKVQSTKNDSMNKNFNII